MNRRARALAVPFALAALALTGCGGGNDAQNTASPSASMSTSSASSRTATASSTPEASASNTAESSETSAPEEAKTQAAAPAGDGEVQQVFQTGGQCIADVWSSSLPYTDALHQQVIDFCSSHQLGDWSHGYDPMDPKNMGGGQSETDESGYQKPDADESGYVGPSKEYYGYTGYVAPGFEYQVGSKCFDASLGRCKTSGEIQTENLGK